LVTTTLAIVSTIQGTIGPIREWANGAAAPVGTVLEPRQQLLRATEALQDALERQRCRADGERPQEDAQSPGRELLVRA
jgi:hypothetical protein